MSIFYQEEVPGSDLCKRCKSFASALKNAFFKCHSSRRKVPFFRPSEPEEPPVDFDQEEEIFVSAVMSKYMESKSKRQSSNIGIHSLCNFLALSMEYSIMDMITPFNGDEFVSAGSHISTAGFDEEEDNDDDAAFVSAKTCFSRCSSSLSDIDFKELIDMKKRSVILEFMHCEGWPFGLCRKALLLPPLPKSPADSWSWKKN